MGNSVSQPTEMCQYFLAISLLKDYYSESKNYISHFFIGNKTCSEGEERKDRTKSLLSDVSNEHHRAFSIDLRSEIFDVVMTI